MEGTHNKSRIYGSTIYFDHHFGMSYSHMQSSLDTTETLRAKFAFEKWAGTYQVTIERYHADNGRFAEKSFRDSVINSGQLITFCGVGAHHQNGIIERHISLLSNASRTLLLHAQQRWPNAITTILWPFA